MTVYSEESEFLHGSLGVVADESDPYIPDGFCARADNLIADKGRLESRKGFRYTHNAQVAGPVNAHMVYLPTFDNDLPVLMWGLGFDVYARRAVNPFQAGAPAANVVISEAAPGSAGMRGAAVYGDRVYYGTNVGIYHVSNFNWGGGAWTKSHITNSPNNIHGLLTFKDRMWAFGTNGLLYYTEIAPFGGYPETWNQVTQNIAFNSPGGNNRILQIIPLGNKLIVFTAGGLFSLTVEGEPGSWTKRTIVERFEATTNTSGCEFRGVVYFVDRNGVWATNGISVDKISQALDSIFNINVAGRVPTYSVNILDDGLVVSRSLRAISISNPSGFVDSPFSVTYYTKLDNIAWTKFNFDLPYGSGSQAVKLDRIMYVSPRLESMNARTSLQYVMFSVSRSNSGGSGFINSMLNVGTYEGYQDNFRSWDNTNTITTENAIETYFQSRYTDGMAPTQLKRLKNAFLSVSNPTSYLIKTAWQFDAGNLTTEQTITDATASASGFRDSEHVAIPADFMYRKTAFHMKNRLVAANADIPFRFQGVHLVKHTERRDDFAAR